MPTVILFSRDKCYKKIFKELCNVLVIKEPHTYKMYLKKPEIDIAKYQCIEVQNENVTNKICLCPAFPAIRSNH